MSCVHAVNGTRLNIRVTKSATPAGLLFTARDREGGKEEYTVFAGWHYAHYLTRNTPELSSKERVTELSAALLKCLKFELVGGKRSLVLKELESKEPEKSKHQSGRWTARKITRRSKSKTTPSQGFKSAAVLSGRGCDGDRSQWMRLTKWRRRLMRNFLEKFMTRRSSTRRKSSIFNPEMKILWISRPL